MLHTETDIYPSSLPLVQLIFWIGGSECICWGFLDMVCGICLIVEGCELHECAHHGEELIGLVWLYIRRDEQVV